MQEVGWIGRLGIDFRARPLGLSSPKDSPFEGTALAVADPVAQVGGVLE
jgi:hypothetical protein